MVLNLANLDEHGCGVVMWAKTSEFYPDLPVLVAANESEVMGLPRSQCV